MKETGLRVKLPWGAEHEHQRAMRLAEGFDFVEVLPKLTLAQVAQQIADAKAVVSVDTGLSHLTAALDKPNFTLFGPTNPGLIGGYGKGQNAIKSVDNRMDSIKADTVFQQLRTEL
jgi:heptosyltransferase-1